MGTVEIAYRQPRVLHDGSQTTGIEFSELDHL